jgi:hypothetical protein
MTIVRLRSASGLIGRTWSVPTKPPVAASSPTRRFTLSRACKVDRIRTTDRGTFLRSERTGTVFTDKLVTAALRLSLLPLSVLYRLCQTESPCDRIRSSW